MAKYILSAFADEAGASLDEQIAALKRNHIQYMEIRSVNGVNICQTPLETVKQYKQQLDAAGIRVMTIGSCIGKVKLTDDYDKHLTMFKHTLEVAKILGATRMRMFSFFTKDPAADRNAVFDHLDEWLTLAQEAGVELYHENEKDIFGDTDNRVLQLIHAFKGRMQFIFDPANFIQCGCLPKDIYPALREHLGYFHIKDALCRTGGVVPAGKGDGDIPYLLTDFARDHDSVMLTVEPHLKTFAGLTDTVSIREDEFVYQNNNEAFDAAVSALKNILEQGELSYE